MINTESQQQTTTVTIEQALQQAIAHHQAGQLPDAERLYRAILQTQPSHPDANHNLGVLAMQVKQPAASLPYFKAALEVNPKQGQYWLSYIDALIQAGQTAAARQVLAQGRKQDLQGAAVEVLAGRLSELPGSEPSPQEIEVLVALFNEGQCAEAATLAQSMTERFPLHGFGWKVLGAALMQMGQGANALAATQKAAILSPGDADAHSNLGNILQKLGRLVEAEASYQRALEIKPDYAEAHNNLGNVLRELGRLDEAEACYCRALQISPDYAVAHNGLGVALNEQGRFLDAVASYYRAIEINPNYAEAYNNLGNTLKDMGQLEEAEANLRCALQIKPDFAGAHNNLGIVLYEQARYGEAEASYQNALQIKPDLAEAYSNLGNALKELGRLEEAEASCRCALHIMPKFVEAYNNFGNILRELGRLDEAAMIYHQAIEIKPDSIEAYSNLLFLQNHTLDGIPSNSFKDACQYGQTVNNMAKLRFIEWPCAMRPERLRIGLVSGDIRNHPVGYFLESLLSQLALTPVEMIAYPTYHVTDEVTARIKPHFFAWKPLVGQSDEAAAHLIHSDGIHVLIDLSGHTRHNRLPMFAWKPAPVQASWLGYFATTGVAAIDYLIADPWTLPEAEEAYFTEKIWRLPETRLCFTPPDVKAEVTSLPALANGYITFGCFNNLSKMNEDVVALWARILASVPSSRLFLKAKQLNEISVRQNTVERFAARGINPNRLVLEGTEARAKYMEAYHRIDIALDPFPYPGGTTSVEGLWMGVPVLTLAGKHFLSRQGVGLLINVGLPEWIADDTDDYVARAVSHASNLQYLAKLRSKLRPQILASPIFDAPRFARHFEAALRGMWQIWREKEESRQLEKG